jgi:sec-independent protein translocase protein TatC
MTTTSPPKPPVARKEFHPDDFRMTVGEHLEDLRRRLILGLLAYVVAFAICLALGKHVIWLFCRPLEMALIHHDINPQIYFTDVAGPFVVYMQISMICGAVLASPWLLYQLWLFVAAGLYPKERKLITKYLPLSIGLLLAGVIVLYFLVLPLSLEFFIEFGGTLPLHLPQDRIDYVTKYPTTTPSMPLYHGNPPPPLAEGQMWIDQDLRRLKVFFGGEPRVITFMPGNLVAPMITLPQYIDMVINLLVAFGLSFQTPLVVMALVRAGILDLEWLRSMRRYVYFIMAVIAAFIIPDVVTGMIALTIPLVLLYELGIYLAARKPPPPPPAPADRDSTPTP